MQEVNVPKNIALGKNLKKLPEPSKRHVNPERIAERKVQASSGRAERSLPLFSKGSIEMDIKRNMKWGKPCLQADPEALARGEIKTKAHGLHSR